MVEAIVLAKVKGKTKKVFILLQLTSQPTFTPLGQYVQEGRRDIFETIVKVDKPRHELVIEAEENDVRRTKLLSWTNC